MSHVADSTPVVVSAAGLVSSLGDIITACGAFRAGLARAAPITYHQVLDEGEYELVPLKGHPAAPLTDGLAAPARWRLFAERALLDLSRHTSLPLEEPAFARTTALIVVTPVLDDARFFHLPPCHADQVWRAAVAPALDNVKFVPGHEQRISMGAAGVPQAFQLASGWLRAGTVRRVIVLVFDSLLDGLSLLWLSDYERLKTDSNPVGLMPGEAGCALLLETQRGAAERGAVPKAVVDGVGFEPHGPHFLTRDARLGSSIGTALEQVLAMRQQESPFSGDLVADLSGEEWRAMALGTAIARSGGGKMGDFKLLVPATCFGDTGTVGPAIGVASVLRSFERGYAKSGESIVLANSEYGEAGAILLRRFQA